jgi:hypothetical protein
MHRICAAVCEPVSAVNRGRYPETKGEEGDPYYFLKRRESARTSIYWRTSSPSREMERCWLMLVYVPSSGTGDPNGAALPNWPRHDPAVDRLIHFTNSDVIVGTDPLKPRLDFGKKAMGEAINSVVIEAARGETHISTVRAAASSTCHHGLYGVSHAAKTDLHVSSRPKYDR